MKILKKIIISIILLNLLALIIYLTLPLLLKYYAPVFLIQNSPAQEIKIGRIYYSGFTNLTLENIRLGINHPRYNIRTEIPKIEILLKIPHILEDSSLKIFYPHITGEIDIKETKLERNIEKKEKRFKYIFLDNMSIENGSLFLDYFKYKKFELKNIKAYFNFKDYGINVDKMHANFLNGIITGNSGVNIYIEKHKFIYNVSLSLEQIDVSKIKELTDLNNINFTGKFTGNLEIKGENLNLKKVSGNLTSSPEGGRIDIKEDRVEEFLKGKSKQYKIAIQQLKNFSYNKGVIDIETNHDNVRLRIVFQGEEGKKDIEFVFHDILGTNMLNWLRD